MSLARVAAETTVLMGEAEARSCVRAINRSLEHARDLLLDLYEREGWRALSYRSWRDCVKAEFGQNQATLYRQLQAAQIERDISQFAKPTSALDVKWSRIPIPDSHLRPLAVLDTPEERREVWAEAVATAPDGHVTERHIRLVVTRHQASEGVAPTAELTAERRTAPACASCVAYTSPDNWFVTRDGLWVWAGSESPPHLRAARGS